MDLIGLKLLGNATGLQCVDFIVELSELSIELRICSGLDAFYKTRTFDTDFDLGAIVVEIRVHCVTNTGDVW